MDEHGAARPPGAAAAPSVTARRLGRIAAAVALALTALMLAVHLWLTPQRGFLRSFHPTGRVDPSTSVEERAADVSLSFLPRDVARTHNAFAVQWRGFWYVPDATAVDVHVNTNDEVELWVASRPVMRRSPRDGLQTVTQRVPLSRGVHEVVVRYRQHGRQAGLAVTWNPPGGEPIPLTAGSVFVDRVTPRQVATADAVPVLAGLAALAWITAGALALIADAGPARQRRRLALASPRVFARRLGAVAAPALLPPVLLFVAGPHTVHAANPDEFVVPFRVLLPWAVAAAFLGWAALMAIGAIACLVSERLTRVWAAVLFAAGGLMWVQGTFLVPDYGPMFGERLDLALHDGRVPYEVILWIGVLAAAAIHAGALARVTTLVSLLFVGLQMGLVLVASAPGGVRDRSNEGWSAPPEGLYALSRSQNVIHIVLDAFLSDFFGEALQEDRAGFDRAFPGFVYFADHLGAFPTTRASMPAMLTGETYRNEEPFERFLGRTVLRRSVATVLAEHGYQVRSITFHMREHPAVRARAPALVRYTIPTPYSSYRDYVRFSVLQLFDLSAFRHAPQLLKRRVYNDDAWLWQRRIAGNTLQGPAARMVRPSNHAAFLDEMAGRLVVGGDAPVYQFVHVALPHPPLVVDADCSFVDRQPLTRGAYKAQSRCALAVVGRLLDRLRALGVYDRSAIVLTADHGWRLPRPDDPLRRVSTPAGSLQGVVQAATPLLAVKPMGAAGPLRVSAAPTAITDIPATIAAMAGLRPGLFPGLPVLEIDDRASRSRSFAFHTWRDADWRREYIDALHVFSVDGPVHQAASWQFRQTIPDPSGGAQVR